MSHGVKSNNLFHSRIVSIILLFYTLLSFTGLVIGVYYSLYFVASIIGMISFSKQAVTKLILFKITRIVLDVNRLANPLIYANRDETFRAAFRKLIRIRNRRIRAVPPRQQERPSQAIKWISGEPHLIQIRPGN